jgi:hypothetical protein
MQALTKVAEKPSSEMVPPVLPRFKLVDAMVMAEPACQIGIGSTTAPVSLAICRGVADMVAMAMGEQDMGHILGRVLEVIAGKAGISREERDLSGSSIWQFPDRKAAWPSQVIFMRVCSLAFSQAFLG